MRFRKENGALAFLLAAIFLGCGSEQREAQIETGVGGGDVVDDAFLLQRLDVATAEPLPPPLGPKVDPGWTVDTQSEWAEAFGSGSFTLVGGAAYPRQAGATFVSRLISFTQRQKFSTMTLKQTDAWGGGKWSANDGSIVEPPGRDAPVFISPADNDYWYLNADKGGGDYHAWHSTDMVNWTKYPNAVGKNWVTSAEYKDGLFYVYYDHENDEDPHLIVDGDLTNTFDAVDPTRHHFGKVFDDTTWGSDMGVFRDIDGTFHIIFEDWSTLNARRHSWDGQIAGHTSSRDGITGWVNGEHANPIDRAGDPTGDPDVTYQHPQMGAITYTPHDGPLDVWGDYELIRVGDVYYLFCDDHPDGGRIRLGHWYTTDLYGEFTYGGALPMNGHPDPTAGFAEGRFFVITQGQDLTSYGPWVDSVQVQVGIDTDGDGTADQWTAWLHVAETYGRIDGFAKVFSRTPAVVDLSGLPAGYGIQVKFKTSNVSAVMDSIAIK